MTTLTLNEYAAELVRRGRTVVPGSAETVWATYESLAMMRMPTFVMSSPHPGEIRRVFAQGRRPVVTYTVEPDASHPANGWLYAAETKCYALDNLARGVRYHIRRGLSQLQVRWIDVTEVLAHGFQAFFDTRTRIGLKDGTVENFTRRFAKCGNWRGTAILGAWKEDQLAACLSIAAVDDWAEIEGGFSRSDCLKFRPNETLVHSALEWYSTVQRCKLVSYGLSSIQPSRDRDGLHHFKTKLGFRAVPVHRAFILHRLLRPIANAMTLKGIDALARLNPRERRLRMAAGLLATVVPNSPTWADVGRSSR